MVIYSWIVLENILNLGVGTLHCMYMSKKLIDLMNMARWAVRDLS
jgi:hypothetical protein